ncbi:phosphotransferase system HPr-like phosphotransfer protein [Microbacterium terrae]|nr:phosphotransferase system HPr-like phosphotransfer protein [Microbacterium terrae]
MRTTRPGGAASARGTVVTLTAEGEGADQALGEFVELLETDLDAA